MGKVGRGGGGGVDESVVGIKTNQGKWLIIRKSTDIERPTTAMQPRPTQVYSAK